MRLTVRIRVLSLLSIFAFGVSAFAQSMTQNQVQNSPRSVSAPSPVNPRSPYAVKFKYARQEVLAINPRKLADCMNFAMEVSEIPPSFDSSHDLCVVGTQPFESERPTLLQYLGGLERTCDFASGEEAHLLNWVLSQPDNSIHPALMFAESYRLNHGNVYAALLTIHQMLRPIARFDARAKYFTRSFNPPLTRKLSQAVGDKLMDIRGDLVERGGEFKGDHMGNWYRIWGTMIYQSLKSGYKPCPDFSHSCSTIGESLRSTLKQTLSSLEVTAMVIGDEFVIKRGQERDIRKLRTDMVGSQTINFLSLSRDRRITREVMHRLCSGADYLEVQGSTTWAD